MNTPCNSKPIPDFPEYLVDDNGAIWSSKTKGRQKASSQKCGKWKRLKYKLNKYGYYSCNMIHATGKPKTMLVHHVVLAAFVGVKEEYMNGLHRNDNKLDNSPNNLYYGTKKDNWKDAVKNKRMWKCEWTGYFTTKKTDCLFFCI